MNKYYEIIFTDSTGKYSHSLQCSTHEKALAYWVEAKIQYSKGGTNREKPEQLRKVKVLSLPEK